MSMIKRQLDDKYKYKLPMSLYSIDEYGDEKNVILTKMVEIIKKNGNIFLLGYPTNNITMLILKLYHENVIRIVNTSKPLMFMTGLLQLHDDPTIYVTISESEKEGDNYQNKFNAFYSLLKNSGCNVIFDEEEHVGELPIENYRPASGNDFDNEQIFNTVKDDLFFNKNDKLNYSSIIKNYPITVKLIQSTEYVKKRENEGISFVPFKKYVPGKDKPECIYGSLCVESKLFGYMYNKGKKWEDVDGYVAYWVGAKLPPQHILGKYSYKKTSTHIGHSQESTVPDKTEEDIKIKQITEVALDLLEPDAKTQLNIACGQTLDAEEVDVMPACEEILTNALQPIALTCPGCFMNWQSYINNIQVKWDQTQCAVIEPASTVGGKYRRKTKKRKSRKMKKNKSRKNKKNKKTLSLKIDSIYN